MKQLSIILTICFGLILSLSSQDLTVTGAPEPIPAGTYDNITIATGAYGVISGNVTVTNSLTINSIGGLEVTNNAVVDGAGTFTMHNVSGLSYDGDTLSNSIALTGGTTFGSNLSFVLSGTGIQNIDELPNAVSALIVNNLDTVVRTSDIEILDSLVIYQGAFTRNGGRLIVNNDVNIINHSEEFHNFTLRIGSSDNTIHVSGTKKLFIRGIDTQQPRNKINLLVDLEIIDRGRLEKGSHIVLNGNNLIYHSNIWFSGYGDPSYIDYTGGGAVIYPMTGTGSRIVNALLSDGSVKTFTVNVTAADFVADGAIEIAYSTEAYGDLAGNPDYLTSYLEVNPVNFNSISYDVDFFYAGNDVVGNEGALSAQKYQAGAWTESPNDYFINATNNIICYNITDTAIISGLTGSAGYKPNLVINDTVTLLDTVAAYDSIIVQSGGVVTIGENFSIKSFIIEKGAEVWFEDKVVSGTTIEIADSALIATKHLQGFNGAKTTLGTIQFMATLINNYAIKYYYGDSGEQNIGGIVPRWGSLGNIVINNPDGVRMANSPISTYNNAHIVLLNGGVNNGVIEINGNTKIINHAAPNALAGVTSFQTKGNNDRRTLTIQGDSTFIFPAMVIDKALDVVVETDIQITNGWGDGYSRGVVYLGDNRLIMDMGTSLADGTKFNFENGTSIKQIVNGAADSSYINYSNFYHGGTLLPFSLQIDSVTERTANAAILIQNIAGMEPNMRDTNNYVGRYITIDTTDINEFSIGVIFNYKNSEVVGVTTSMEAGFYDGAAWDTSNASFDAAAYTVTVNSIVSPGSVAAGNHVGLMAPVVTSFLPINGAVDQAKDVVVSVTFDQDVVDGPNIAAISINNPESVAVTGVSGATSTTNLIIAHDPFGLTGSYTVTIPAGAVRNADGLSNAEAVTWTFDVLLMDAPEAIAYTPEASTTTENASVVIQAALNQKVTEKNLSGVTITGPATVTGVIASIVNDSIIDIAHDALTANGTYRVTIPAGAVENADFVENAEISWEFNLSGLSSLDALATSDVKIYPIPAYGSVQVHLPENSTITIRNILGSVVDIIDAKAGTQVINLNSGIYLFTIDGTTHKVIIK